MTPTLPESPAPAGPPTPRNCGLATASLVCGIFAFCTFITGIAGLILGIVGLSRINKSAGQLTGKGQAIAGIVLSCAGMVVLIAIIGIVGVFFGVRKSSHVRNEMLSVMAHNKEQDAARVAAARADIASIEVALDTFEINCGRYPTTEEGLQALTTQPSGLTGWRGPYLKRGSPNDAWGNPFNYQLSPAGTAATHPYRLWSNGPDGLDGTQDDISDIRNWSN